MKMFRMTMYPKIFVPQKENQELLCIHIYSFIQVDESAADFFL